MATTVVNDYVELVPEFFCCPTFLLNLNDLDLGVFKDKQIGDVELPPWAPRAVDFIYKHREALESPYVTAHLNDWIDLIWGWRQEGDPLNEFHPFMYESIWNDEWGLPAKTAIETTMKQCGQIPHRMFNSPHPKSLCQFEKSAIESEIQIRPKPGLSLVYVSLDRARDSEFVFYGITDSNHLYRLRYLPRNLKTSFTFLQGTTGGVSLIINRTLFSGSLTGEICCCDLVAQEQFKIRDHIGKINCLAGDRRYLMSGGGDTATSIFSSTKPFNRVFTVPSYTGEVISCAVNSEFAAVASGTRDGSVLIFSTTSRTVVHVLKLGNRCPKKILITKKWGFVVVYETETKGGDVSQWIEVFTIDGLFVRREKCPCDVQVWSTFSNTKGFDYIAMTGHTGALYVFEAFYLRMGPPLFRCVWKLVGLSYSEDLRIVCAVDVTGTGFFIPLCLDK
jgi:hypothetical protein